MSFSVEELFEKQPRFLGLLDVYKRQVLGYTSVEEILRVTKE